MGCLFFNHSQPFFFYNHELASFGRFTYLCLAQIKSVFVLISAPWLSSWFWDFEESQDLHQRCVEYFRYFIHCPLHYWLTIKVCSLSCHSRPPQCSLGCWVTYERSCVSDWQPGCFIRVKLSSASTLWSSASASWPSSPSVELWGPKSS